MRCATFASASARDAVHRTRFLIVGAGVTGLALADRLASQDYMVVEATDSVGGYCKTIRRDGFVWDYSGHFFHFRYPEIEQDLLGRMRGQRVHRIVRQSRIFWGDRLIDFPFQTHIHQLPQDEFIECLHDLYFRDSREPSSFLDMLHVRFGRAIAEKFLVPYNEKLYATDLATLDVDAMGRFFPHADLSAVIRTFRRADNPGYNAVFTYPEGGAVEYVEALAAGVSRQRIFLDEKVERIDLARKVATTTRRQLGFEYMVSSVPFDRLLAMAGVPYERPVYSWNKVLVLNMGFDRKGPAGVHWMYVPQRDLVFYRVGFYDNILGADRMSLYVEIGFPKEAVVDAGEVERLRVRVLEDLRRCRIVDEQRLVAWHAVVLDPAYVHITRTSIADVQRKKRLLESRGVYSAGRYGSWTYCSIEDNIFEARALADMFNAGEALTPSE